MTTLQENDLFLVEREDTQYKVENKNMGQVLDTDLFLVEREGVHYKVTGDQVGAGPTGEFDQPVAVLTPLNGAGIGAGVPYNPISSPITTVGAGGAIEYETSNITNVNESSGTFAGANSDWTNYLSAAPSGGPAFAPEGSGSYIYGSFSDENNSYYEIGIPPIYTGSAIKIAWRGSGTGNYNSNVLELRDDADNIILSTPFDNPSNNQSVSNIVSVGSVTGTVTKLRLRIDTGWAGSIDSELLGGFAGIYVDDVKIVDGDTYSSTQLTFADNTDLKYFQAGDVVQEAVDQRVYSDGFISGQPSAGNKADVFDGNYGIGKTYPGYGCVTTNLKACVFNPPIAFEGGTIEVAAYRTEGGGAFTVYIDGTRYDINIANTNNLQWNSRDDLPAGNIESFGMNTNANAWGQVRLNGVDLIDGNGTVTPEVKVISADPANSQMVVDGGKWAVVNDSRVWSDSATVSGTEVAGKDKTKAFDGTDTVAAISASGQYFDFVFDPPIPVNTSLRLKSAVSSTSVAAANFQINNVDRSTVAIGFPAAGGIATDVTVWTTIPSEFITNNELSQLRIGWSGAWQNIAGIEIDGRLLLDNGISDLGETSVSKSTTYDASLICSDDTELANMVGPITMTDSNGDLVTPVTSTIESVETTGGDITGVDQRYTWSDPANFERPPLSASYPYSAMFDGQITGFYGNSSLTEGGGVAPGPIVWNAPAGANLSGNIFMTSGQGDSNYASPIVYVNGSTTPLTQISVGDYGATYGYLCYVFEHIGPVNQIRIEPAVVNLDAVLMSIGVGTKWLLDPGAASVDPAVCPAVDVDSDLLTLTFESPNIDLQYFQAGDVVQGPNWNQSQTWSANVNNDATPVNAYDGNLDTFDYGSSYTNTFTTPITVSKLRVYADGPQDSVQVYLDGAAVNVPWSGSVTKQWWDVPISGSAVFSQVTITSSSAALYAVEADGKILVDAGIAASGAVKVVSVDPDNSQMVVDGGNWIGSDGSTAGEVDLGWIQTATWSDTATAASAANAFNGSLTGGAAGLNARAIYTTSPFTAQKIRLYKNGNNEGQTLIWVNDTQYAMVNTAVASGWIEYDLGVPTLVNKLEASWTGGAASLWAIGTELGILVDAGIPGAPDPIGDTFASLSTLEASATDVIGVDGNTLQIDGVSGTWKTGLHIKGAEINNTPPSPTDVVFTSMNGGTTPVTGTDASLTKRLWTLEKSSAQNGPWIVVGEYDDTSANDSQDGATPWASRPDLEPNTYYQVKVKYFSVNAASVESIYNTFKTGDA